MNEIEHLQPSLSSDITPPQGLKNFLLLALSLLLLISALGLYVLLELMDVRIHSADTEIVQLRNKLDETQNQAQKFQEKLHNLEEQLHSISGAKTDKEVVSPSSETSPISEVKAIDIAKLQNDYLALSATLSTLEKQLKQTDTAANAAQIQTQSLLASSVAFVELKDAAMAGHAYVEELGTMRLAVHGDNELLELLSKLEPYASAGAPTTYRLYDTLLDRESEALNATEKMNAKTWWQRLWANLKGQISIRPLHGGGEENYFKIIEEDLGRGDASSALESFESSLEPETQKALADWHTQLTARRNINETLRGIAARLAATTKKTDAVPFMPAQGEP